MPHKGTGTAGAARRAQLREREEAQRRAIVAPQARRRGRMARDALDSRLRAGTVIAHWWRRVHAWRVARDRDVLTMLVAGDTALQRAFTTLQARWR